MLILAIAFFILGAMADDHWSMVQLGWTQARGTEKRFGKRGRQTVGNVGIGSFEASLVSRVEGGMLGKLSQEPFQSRPLPGRDRAGGKMTWKVFEWMGSCTGIGRATESYCTEGACAWPAVRGMHARDR